MSNSGLNVGSGAVAIASSSRQLVTARRRATHQNVSNSRLVEQQATISSPRRSQRLLRNNPSESRIDPMPRLAPLPNPFASLPALDLGDSQIPSNKRICSDLAALNVSSSSIVLPSDLLIQAFEFLDLDDLLSLLFVCQAWNKHINTRSQITKEENSFELTPAKRGSIDHLALFERTIINALAYYASLGRFSRIRKIFYQLPKQVQPEVQSLVNGSYNSYKRTFGAIIEKANVIPNSHAHPLCFPLILQILLEKNVVVTAQDRNLMISHLSDLMKRILEVPEELCEKSRPLLLVTVLQELFVHETSIKKPGWLTLEIVKASFEMLVLHYETYMHHMESQKEGYIRLFLQMSNDVFLSKCGQYSLDIRKYLSFIVGFLGTKLPIAEKPVLSKADDARQDASIYIAPANAAYNIMKTLVGENKHARANLQEMGSSFLLKLTPTRRDDARLFLDCMFKQFDDEAYENWTKAVIVVEASIVSAEAARIAQEAAERELSQAPTQSLHLDRDDEGDDDDDDEVMNVLD